MWPSPGSWSRCYPAALTPGDRLEKWIAYRALESLREYVVMA